MVGYMYFRPSVISVARVGYRPFQMKTLLQEFTQAPARPVKLRLRIPDGPIHDLGDLFVLVALDVMEFDDQFVTWSQLFDRPFQIHAVDRSGQLQVRCTELLASPTAIVRRFIVIFRRCFGKDSCESALKQDLPQSGAAKWKKPSRREMSGSAQHCQECFLGEVLRLG